jgi:hypothetical protein
MKVFTIGLCTLISALTFAHPKVWAATPNDDDRDNGDSRGGAQIAQLYALQAEFHDAATVRDPVNGDSAEVIEQRLKQMLSLWTDDPLFLFSAGTPVDGYYKGKGEPDDPSTCPTPSDNPANRGTVCTFFKYVAGSFQPQNKFVSLAPSFKTRFQLNADHDRASVYFECHFFNVALDPATGKPLWTGAAHLALDGIARKVDRKWLFSHATAPAVGVPIP